MLDVARRSHFSPFEARVGHQGSRRRSRLRDERDLQVSTSAPQPGQRRTADHRSESSGYALDFVVQPPRELHLGYPINHAVTLQVRVMWPHQSSSRDLDDTLHQYFAVASLVRSDNGSAMPQGTLVGPQLVDSIHAPDTVYNGAADAGVMGYISFPLLSVQNYGSYRLRVTMMRVDGLGACAQSATTLQAVDSGRIQVTDGQYSFY